MYFHTIEGEGITSGNCMSLSVLRFLRGQQSQDIRGGRYLHLKCYPQTGPILNMEMKRLVRVLKHPCTSLTALHWLLICRDQSLEIIFISIHHFQNAFSTDWQNESLACQVFAGGENLEIFHLYMLISWVVINILTEIKIGRDALCRHSASVRDCGIVGE